MAKVKVTSALLPRWQVTLMVAETGKGVIGLGDVERLARALGVTVSELLRPVGNSWEERVVMALLEQGNNDLR